MNWRLNAAAVPLLLFGLSIAAQAQTADELVARNLAARGGAAQLAAIHTIVSRGELRFPGDFKLVYKETRARVPGKADGAVRIDASLQGLTLIQAYDGNNAWRVNPFEGRRDAERMGADEARELADEGSIDGALLAARAKGSQVDYLGREDIDGTDAYKLRVSQPDGTVFTYWLDPDAMLEIKILERRSIRGAEKETETDLGDYERVGGVYFPFSITSGPKDTPPSEKEVVTIASAEANVAVTPDTFARPAAPAAQSK
ncbi:MAG TPA: hypothetical protein VHT03_15480 [Rhizomicrobium sp.]|nr:hypothetical protein [Rhizomicrobium sp.]